MSRIAEEVPSTRSSAPTLRATRGGKGAAGRFQELEFPSVRWNLDAAEHLTWIGPGTFLAAIYLGARCQRRAVR